MIMRSIRNISIFSILLIALVALNGCGEETEPTIPQSEHFEPEGWVIRDATTKPILVVWQGVIQQSWNSVDVPDTLYAPLNALSDHFTVKFLDLNRNIINPPADSEHDFGWLITENTKLEIVRDNPSDWAFHLKGLITGTTTLELQVLHLGHVDVKTPKIPVIIKEDTTAYGEPVGLRLSYEENGNILASATSSSSSGILEVTKDSTSDHIAIEFFDSQGRYFQPEYPLHSLGFSIADNNIVDILPEANEPWVIKIKGKVVGNTTVIFKLMVGGNDEFVSFPINISVL